MATTGGSSLISRAELRARRDPSFARALAALVDAPTSGAGEYTHQTARALNEQRVADALSAFRDAALTTDEVRQRLGLRTPQAVHRLRGRGRILGVQIGNGTWFPDWQFVSGRLRPDLPRLLEALGSLSADVVAVDRVMRLTREELGDRSIADLLDDPDQGPTAWILLEQLGR